MLSSSTGGSLNFKTGDIVLQASKPVQQPADTDSGGFQAGVVVAAQPDRRAGIARMRADRLVGAEAADDNFVSGTVFALRRRYARRR
jgi:hypothetical protein